MTIGRITRVPARLLSADGGRVVARLSLVIAGEEIPALVMLDGEPYLKAGFDGEWIFARARPYRADLAADLEVAR